MRYLLLLVLVWGAFSCGGAANVSGDGNARGGDFKIHVQMQKWSNRCYPDNSDGYHCYVQQAGYVGMECCCFNNWGTCVPGRFE